MDISPAESHLSELLYSYFLTEHGWKGTEVKRIWWQDIEVTPNFLGIYGSSEIYIKAYG